MSDTTFPALDSHELAWAAGFFDGEGNIRVKPNRHSAPRIYYYPAIFMPQIDPQVLDRFRCAVGGLGRVSGPHDKSHQNRRPQWYYECYSFERVQAVIALLWNWLSPVKREQSRAVFLKIAELQLPKLDFEARYCSVEGCGKPYAARGWCMPHYQKWWHGQKSGVGSTL